MKKRLFDYPIWWMLIPFVMTLLLIVIGSFADWNVSKGIADTSDWFGRFMETYGMAFGYSFITVSGTLLFLGMFSTKKMGLRFLGIVLLLLSMAATVYYLVHQIGPSSSEVVYGIRVSKPMAYVSSGLFTLFAFLIPTFTLSHKEPKRLILVGLILLCSIVIQWAVIHFLKKFPGRPRFRYLTDMELNTAGETFRNFWQWNPMMAVDDYHKSFPSGHSGMSSVLLLLPLFHPLARKKAKHGDLYLYLVGILYFFVMMYSRVRTGAHYLTDVGFGGLFGTLACSLSIYLGSLYLKRHPFAQKEEETQHEMDTQTDCSGDGSSVS